MGRLFGTDGARGIANSELTCELTMQIGRAAALVLTKQTHRRPRFLIGMDTRVSSGMLEACMVAGLASVGADSILVGVVPTPAVAWLIGRMGADAGVMISASHNPCEYNGIKLFDKNGYKLPDQTEEEIESIVLDGNSEMPIPLGGDLGRVTRDEEALELYIKHITSTTDERFDGLHIALDCANGSAARTAEKLFRGLGAECHMLSDEPDGVNINLNCGSTHMEHLMQIVKLNGYDAGLAFDGDADRCLAVDRHGKLIDGDQIMAVLAKDLKLRGKLEHGTVVATVMSNIGFFHFGRNNGIAIEKTAVGDRYVLERMREAGYNIGGEQSGHIIFLDHATTGDGQLSGVQLLSCMKRQDKALHELAGEMEKYPQVLENAAVSGKIKTTWQTDPEIQRVIRDAERVLGDNGRILVRASGTEPLIRVMIEGKDQAAISDLAKEIAALIKSKDI